MLLPVIDRSQAREQTVVVRADAAFALPPLYEALEQRAVAYAIRLPASRAWDGGERREDHRGDYENSFPLRHDASLPAGLAPPDSRARNCTGRGDHRPAG